jgi:two-component system, NarL family, invasion response regulator UvrY
MQSQTLNPDSASGRHKTSVMLVDDAPIFMKMAKLWLESSMGDEIDVVDTASSGEECLAKAQSLAPDLILMDLHMPGMGGLATIPLVHILFPETCVIALSFRDDDRARNLVSAIGGADLVSKVDMKTKLASAIHKAIAERDTEFAAIPIPA